MVTSWSSGNIAHFWWNKKPISYTTPQKRATVGAMSILAENKVVDDEWKSLLSIGNFANQLFGAPFKGIQDSHEFWIPHRGFQIPRYWIPVFSQWHLDSGFKSLEGLRIPWAVFWIPKPNARSRIPRANFPRFWIPQAQISWILESGFHYMRQNYFGRRDWQDNPPN